ncbi:hypothetical protein TTHT_2171 [Thermotomaculum hydrothermale]|uniref:ResB-like domain-containing protein n=1 Tax=Thermotomaculum hydrothermale TaxID=981385 RepID=A0A7R6SZ87_9BACT|nr:cytochrome c biogenesis protein ResB [Thermotomaculum hydrothermale]BBB33599.1 hypothetical protein TTHT_2171 [Thermotomaculum hydrothermale]
MKKKSLGFYFLTSGIIILYFFLLQLLYNVRRPIFYGGAVLLALAFLFFLVKDRKAVYDYLSSIKLAVALIVYTAIAVIMGTLILQNVQESQYLQHYSVGFYKFIKLFTLQDTYHSLWFMLLVGLLNINLLLCTFQKWPITKKKIGFFLIHLSIFVIVLGGSISAIWGIKGYIHFHVGETHNDFNLTRYNEMLDKKHKLDFGVRLDKFEIEYYPPDYRVYVYTRKSTDRDFGKPYSLKAKEGEVYKVNNAKLKILKFFKDYNQKEVLVHNEDGVPGVEVLLKTNSKTISGLFFDTPGRDRFFLPNGEGLVIFKWKTPKNNKEAISVAKEKYILTINCAEGNKTLSVELGKTYDFSKNYLVKVDDFVPSFSIDTKSGKVVSKGDNPDNPALHLIFINKNNGEKLEHWTFQNFPEFSHGKKIPDGCSIKFLYIPSMKDKPVYIVSAEKDVVEVLNGKVKKKFKLENNELVFNNYKLVFNKFDEKSSLKLEEYSASDKYKNPVVKVLWEENGKSHELQFSAKDQKATFLDNGKVALLLRDKNTDPKAYRSYVTVIDHGKEVKKHVIEVNSPLVYHGYYFYQSNYDPKDPNYSGISVSKDPGVYIVYLGFFMLTIGGILRFYFKM